MFDDVKLWKERLGYTSKEMGRYLRYIFNGHLVVVMLFLLGTAAFYYQGWVKTIPDSFPVALIMTIVLVFFLTYSPTYTFLHEADKIFLLPLETKLSNYFFRSGILSALFQSYFLLLILAALMPMYAQVNNEGFQRFLLFFFLIVVFKILNVFIRKYIFYYIETSVHFTDTFVRFCINGLFLYLLFSQSHIFLYIVLFIPMVFLLLYFRRAVQEKGMKWELLIEQEEKRMGSFYRLANLFTDVPKLKARVKRRKWLDWLLQFISYGQDHTYTHLFVRTFLRSGDYLGLFIRLTVIGGLGIYFISSSAGQLIIVLLFLYLTGFQLMPLRIHHQNNLFADMYPVSQSIEEQSFNNLLAVILFIQAVVFSLIILLKGKLLFALITLGVEGLFVFIFVYIYRKKQFMGGR